MINLKFIKVIVILSVVPYSLSQYSETLRSDRPGQALGPNSVGENVLQFQPGIDYYSFLNLGNPPQGILANSAIRIGLTEKLELNAFVDYQYEQSKLDSTTFSLAGINNLFLGFRVNFVEQHGFIPTSGFQINLKIPKVSNDFGSEQLATNMVLMNSWNLPKGTSITTNWILSYDGNSIYPTGKYVFNFGFPVYRKWGAFIENYGQINDGLFETRFDGGVSYLLNQNFLFDLSAGFGNNLGVSDFFISSGISWRLVKFRK